MLWWGKRKKNLRREDKNDLNASSRIRFVCTEYVNLIDRSNRFVGDFDLQLEVSFWANKLASTGRV